MVETGGLTVLSLIAIVVLARFLTPREIGIAAMALGIVQMLGILVEMLFHDALVQRPNLDGRHLGSVLVATVGLAILFTVGCWLVAEPVARLFGEPELGPVLAWMSLSILFQGSAAAPLAELRRDLRFRALAVRSLVGRIGGAVAGIGLAVAGYGVWALVAQQVANMALGCAAAWALSWPRYAWRLSPSYLGELWRFALASISALLIGSGMLRVFSLVVGYFLGATVLGHINLAFRVVDTLRDVLYAAGNQVALPLFSRRQHETAAMRRAYVSATDLTSTITVPMFVGLFATAEVAVVVVFGEKWLPSVPYVQLLSLLAVLFLAQIYAQSTLTAMGRPQRNLLINAMSFAVAVAGAVLFARFGGPAAMVVWATALLVEVPLRAYYVHRVAGVPVRDQLRAPLPSMAASAIMVAGLWALDAQMLVGLPPTQRLAAMAAAGAAIYGAALPLLSPESLPRLYRFLVGEFRERQGTPGL